MKYFHDFSYSAGEGRGRPYATSSLSSLAMVDSASAQPLAQSANRSQKSLVRHVSFNESTLKQSQMGDVEAHTDEEERGKKRNARCNMCCAWTSIIVGTLTFIILLFGVIFFIFLKANLPEFHVQTLDVRKLDLDTEGNDQIMDVDVEVGLNATNKNAKVALSYSAMDVVTSANNVNLGREHLPGFNQKPHNTAQLKVRIVRQKAPVASPVTETDATTLQNDVQNHRLFIDVDLQGKIDWIVNGYTISRFPFRVYCHGINQLDIDNDNLPECEVKMTPVS